MPFSAHMSHIKGVHGLGLFRVHIQQVEYHHDQRPQDEAWVRELREKMQEGLERSSYPISAILTDDQAWDEYSGPPLTGDGSMALPETFSVRVFDGQHRIEALRGLPIESSDKWWLAVVYRAALEQDNPAIFYTMMHLGNEQETKKPHNDADQFLLVHRLRRLREAGRLSMVEYKGSAERIMGLPGCTARQAIPALVRSKAVSTKIAEMLSSPHFRAQFALAAWKRLVTGRMYQLTGWILEESEQQMILLNGATRHPVSAAFKLPVAKCSWEHLESAVRKADHPWRELEGGATEALHRVRFRPQRERAMNPLDQMGKDTWTFESHILLPSVLSSNLVEKELIMMNQLCQHLVHVIAGPTAIKDYATRQAKDDETCSPAGYMWRVLGERGRRADGSLNNFPDLVFRVMWTHRAELTSQLALEGIKDAATTTAEAYISLIGRSQRWWEVLRLFRTPSFSLGLPVTVPKEFLDTRDLNPVTPAQSLPGSTGTTGHESPPLQGESVAGQLVVAGEAIQDQPTLGTSMVMRLRGSCPVGDDPSDPGAVIPVGSNKSSAVGGTPIEGHVYDQGQASASDQHTHPPSKNAPRKRRRGLSSRFVRSDEDEGEYEYDGEDEVASHQDGRAALLGGGLAIESSGLGHRSLSACIMQLTNKAQSLGRTEAMAVADLLKALVDLPSPSVLADVVKELAHKVPRLKRKAMKREEIDYDEEEETGEQGQTSFNQVGELTREHQAQPEGGSDDEVEHMTEASI
ncbi:hypothetical protein FS749_001366 [Ceratobasidium sp. UAMH 11750]|nr:hypothetical protein FS749_001366 [Ceratobasidium sp. UAMH 11750]